MKNISRSGKRWERELADEVDGKRQPSSGAFGTQINRASLTGDVVTKYPFLSKMLHIECKYGYGGSKTMRIRREWLTKVRKEAERANRYPAVALKFRDVRTNQETAKMICFNLDTWNKIVRELENMYLEYLSYLKKEYEDGGRESDT